MQKYFIIVLCPKFSKAIDPNHGNKFIKSLSHNLFDFESSILFDKCFAFLHE